MAMVMGGVGSAVVAMLAAAAAAPKVCGDVTLRGAVAAASGTCLVVSCPKAPKGRWLLDERAAEGNEEKCQCEEVPWVPSIRRERGLGHGPCWETCELTCDRPQQRGHGCGGWCSEAGTTIWQPRWRLIDYARGAGALDKRKPVRNKCARRHEDSCSTSGPPSTGARS